MAEKLISVSIGCARSRPFDKTTVQVTKNKIRKGISYKIIQ